MVNRTSIIDTVHPGSPGILSAFAEVAEQQFAPQMPNGKAPRFCR